MSELNHVHYEVAPAIPGAHIFEVTCTIPEPDPKGQVLSMAAWIPGSYMIRDFARNIVMIRAESTVNPVAMHKLDKQSWRCAPCRGPLRIRYQIYSWDLSVRSAHLDTTHGYFNGTSLFLKVHGLEHRSCTVELLPPYGDGNDYSDWRVATTLPRIDAPEHGFGLYQAQDYDDLIDHPVEMGRFTLLRFNACGVPHEVAITGNHRTDGARLTQDLTRICEHHIRFFGEPAPMSRYLFQVMAVGDGYGGLEHRDSTSLMCKRDDLPQPGESKIDNGYRSFLGLCSHEYFHTWNIKRIKPAVFQPYDLTREVHTPLLWAFEGITSYYDDLALVRSGLIEAESYLELLGQTITRVIRGNGRHKQSVAESSFDAWTKFYKQDENAPNAIVSYYAKGALVALALDLTIRRESKDTKSLDDVMRRLWQEHGQKGIGVDEAGLERLIGKVGGLQLAEFFDRAVRGTEELELERLLATVGVDYHLRAADSAEDLGGKAGAENNGGARRWTLGARTSDDPLGAKVAIVYDNGPAQGVGISAGDIIIAVDGIRATHGNLEKLLRRRGQDRFVTLTLFRRDELMEFDLNPQAAPNDTCYLTLAPKVNATTEKRRRDWLGG